MSEVEEIERRVQNLSTEEFATFRDWFLELDNKSWDKQIATDFRAGKFERLISEAKEEFAQGKVREL
jgi:hypothetical protein